VRVSYDEREHDVTRRADHPELYAPEKVNPSFPNETGQGDPDAALADAAVSVDATYTTPAFHNNPMEPHATVAVW
jgi:xanthine dehydrogenase YagR molybdenum-binding subunit